MSLEEANQIDGVLKKRKAKHSGTVIKFMPLVVPYFFTAKGSLCDYYLITVPLCFAFRFFSTPSIWLASSERHRV